ncbi:isatin hydrolase [Trichonephila clavipes]|nr:isatin hydrolase [Trichonephila clavipes]
MLCVVYAAPLSKRMVDMTYTFDDTIPHYPIVKGFEIHTVLNGTSPNGYWALAEEYSLAIHLGTHMDSPAHFPPHDITAEKIPVEHLIAPAAVIDITAKAELDPDAEATVEDLLQWESTTGQSLDETIVLLRNGWGKYWTNQTAFLGTADGDVNHSHFPGFSGEAATWLVENRNIYGVGTEAISFDKGNSRQYPVHRTILGHGLFGLENVANVDKIPIYGAELHVMPMKVGRASGAPVRIIASFPEIIV